MSNNMIIRALEETDNFAYIQDLLNQTRLRMESRTHLQRGEEMLIQSPEEIKHVFFPEQNAEYIPAVQRCDGYVYEEGNHIQAVLGIATYEHGATFVDMFYGSDGKDDERYVRELWRFIQNEDKYRLIDRVYVKAFLFPGEIRNAEVEFWEQFGFVSPPDGQYSIRLPINQHQIPSQFPSEVVTCVQQASFEGVCRFLEEHHELEIMDYLIRDGLLVNERNTICLQFSDPSQVEILGYAYYVVEKITGDPHQHFAANLGFYFSPTLKQGLHDIRSFIELTMASMMQMGIHVAFAHMLSGQMNALLCLLEKEAQMAEELCLQMIKKMDTALHSSYPKEASKWYIHEYENQLNGSHNDITPTGKQEIDQNERKHNVDTVKRRYVNAFDILPKHVVRSIQQYVQGQPVYIPQQNRQKWGAGTGIRAELEQRNANIVREYKQGAPMAELAARYHLSVNRIRSIVYAKNNK